MSSLPPVLANDSPLIKLLEIALTFEHVLQRPTPRVICGQPTGREGKSKPVSNKWNICLLFVSLSLFGALIYDRFYFKPLAGL